MDKRERIQQEAREAWLNSNRKTSIIAGTGTGKSKIALDIIRELNPRSIVLLTNSENLRDVNWKKEFEKFGMLEYWDRTVSRTYQAMYDKEWEEYELGILDEVDFACSPEYGKCLVQASRHCTNVLAMTGFCTEEKEELLSSHFPIVYRISTQDAQDAEMLNQTEFIFIEFPLNLSKTIEQKKKAGGSFKVSENDQYAYYDKEFQKAMIVKNSLDKKYRLLGQDPSQHKDWQGADWKFKITAVKRKSILNNLDSSVAVVKKLLELIHSEQNNKVLIFSALTKQADKLPNPFHGNSKEDDGIAKLNSGEFKTMAVVKKVNRGTNLVGVNYIIKESFDGSETDFQQTHGRLTRLPVGEVGRYIILIPMFQALVRTETGAFKRVMLSTQARSWATKMTATFDTSRSRTITLDKDLRITLNDLKGNSTVAAG